MSVLGCDVPLMQAPLGRGAAAPLAIAVSQAGGLGTVGASWTDPSSLREQIRSIMRATDRPFCVNLVLDFEQDERLEVAVEERVPWVSFSFGMRRQMIERALARGATAVVMGTRFVASDECDAHPHYKTRLLEADGHDTVLTRLFDVGWDAPHRVLRNSTYERWEAAGRPEAGQRPSEGEEVAPGIVRYAVNLPLSGGRGDVEAMAMYAGQGVGAIDTVESAAAIIEGFAATLRPS